MGSASSVLELLATSCSSSALTSSCSTASTMGITMAVVDVFESHMESSVVQHMKQSSSLRGGEAGGASGQAGRRRGRGASDRGATGAQLPAPQGSLGNAHKPGGAGLESRRWRLPRKSFFFLCRAVSFVLPGRGTE